MKRRAYIGLSSPVGYYFDNDKKHFNEPWKWNPILESPQGLITLFDELWFLSRALCPINLRNESYVKFIDEDSDFTPLIKGLNHTLESKDLYGLLLENPFIETILDFSEEYPYEHSVENFSPIIESIYGNQANDRRPIDNHSHGINLCGLNISACSMKIELLAYDIAILNRMGTANIELITNSFNSSLFKSKPSLPEKAKISQGITIKRIPILQTPTGPVIERIDSIRENNFLVDFRNKILQNENPDNFIDVVNNVEKEFERYRNTVLLEKQGKGKLAASVAKNFLSFLVGMAAPKGMAVISLVADIKDTINTKNFNWTGFLAEIELKK